MAAATSPVGLRAPLNAPLDYPSETKPPQFASVVPSSYEGGDGCWIPATTQSDVQPVLDSIILDDALVLQRRTIPVAYQTLREFSEARHAYLQGMELIRSNWENAGKIVTDDIARQISQNRNALRQAIRARYPTTGFMAKLVYDVPRHGGTDAYLRSIASKVEEKIAAGKAAEVIESALKSNLSANRIASLAKATVPVARALSIGGNVAMALEIPYRVYQLDVAQTREQQQKAIVALSESTAAATVAAICIVVSIGTGGVGLLACGVAPVAFGLFAGSAARAIMSRME